MKDKLGRRLSRRRFPPLLGSSRSTQPISHYWGNDRGTPIDRYFIDRFLHEHRSDIRGDILEVKDTRYAEVFGSAVGVVDVLDIDPDNERASVVADLTRPATLPEQHYDCFILTQTLQYVFDLSPAVESVARVLRPTGVALVTLPSVSRVTASVGVDREFWRFTTASAQTLFHAQFDDVEVHAFGNVLTCAAFLYGLASEELGRDELETRDEFFPTLIAVRASRPRRAPELESPEV
jgi:SAM-dependent methyltransferase